MILIMGLPGSGKSFFARKLSEKTGALQISSDLLRKSLFSGKHYTEQEKEIVYHKMLEFVDGASRHELDIVLDATFYKDSLRQLFIKKSEQLNATVKLIKIVADESLIRKRLEKERPDSDADFSVYQNIKSSFEQVTEDHLILISEENNLDEMIDKSIRYLNDGK